MHGWTRCTGMPELVRCDRGTQNRGVFGSTLAQNGVVIRLEAPEQFELGERRGATLKKMMSKVIKDTHASGRESMDMILNECLNAANEMTRHGCFASAQWVLSRLPRTCHQWATKMNVSMWVLCKHMLTDQRPSMYSHVTERRHVKLSYAGIAVNESDVLLYERPHPWLDPTKLETLSCFAEKHVQVNMDCNGASVPD